MSLKIICMSFDGEFQKERPEFDDIEAAWEYSNDLGSKWIFYPFHFVVTASGKTIKDAPHPFDPLIGRRVKTVAALFERFAKTEEAQGMGVKQFAFALPIKERKIV
jgi:hypothetical protein